MKKFWICVIIGFFICLGVYVKSQYPGHQNIGEEIFHHTMASQKTYKPQTESVVGHALEKLEHNRLIPDYEKNEKEIREILSETAQKEARLTAKMVHMNGNKTMREVEKEMSAIIGHKRVDFIKNSFKIETYRMKIIEKPYSQLIVQVYRMKAEIQTERMLATSVDMIWAIAKQLTSLMVELFICVYSVVSIRIDLQAPVMNTIFQKVEEFALEPAFQKAYHKFVKTWNEAGGSAWEKAKAIFYLLKDNYSLQLFWKFTNLIFKHMSTRKKIRTIGQVAATIVAAFLKNGIALIARIALAVDNGFYLAEKIVNLVKFFQLEKTMKINNTLTEM